MPRAGLLSDVSHSPAECGGAYTSPGSGSHCGSLFHHVAGGAEACLLLAPCQPPSALSCGGMGTQCVTPQDVSGGSPADPTPGIPCGRLVLDSAPDRDASSHDHRSQPPGALSPGCMPLTGSSILAASGASSQCSQQGDPCDPSGRTGGPSRLSSLGQRAMVDCCTPSTPDADRESPGTLSLGCFCNPGNIMNDVSGVPPLSST